MRERKARVRAREVRRMLQRLLEVTACFLVRFRAAAPQALHAPEPTFVRGETLARNAASPRESRLIDLERELADDRTRDAVEHVEHLVARRLPFFGPELELGRGIDQRGRDTRALTE